MVASRTLGKLRGISEEDLIKIGEIHENVHQLMITGLVSRSGHTDTRIERLLTEADTQLQVLWKFPIDPEFHTYVKLYRFRREWHGRKFKCIATGEEVTIDASDLHERECIPVGEGFVDVGRYGAYHRTVGCGEISE